MLLELRCTASIIWSRRPSLCLEFCFGSFLLRLSRIKHLKVILMGTSAWYRSIWHGRIRKKKLVVLLHATSSLPHPVLSRRNARNRWAKLISFHFWLLTHRRTYYLRAISSCPPGRKKGALSTPSRYCTTYREVLYLLGSRNMNDCNFTVIISNVVIIVSVVYLPPIHECVLLW